MALSDQLFKLSVRAKQVEEHEAVAREKAKAELEQDIQAARDFSQAQAEDVRKKVDASKSEISTRWRNTQRSWSDHVAAGRIDIQEKKARLDLKMAQRDADAAEADASLAIDYAYAAIDEAEYEVLTAIFAREHADELSAAGARG